MAVSSSHNVYRFLSRKVGSHGSSGEQQPVFSKIIYSFNMKAEDLYDNHLQY
jgi:hypothetical protein